MQQSAKMDIDLLLKAKLGKPSCVSILGLYLKNECGTDFHFKLTRTDMS